MVQNQFILLALTRPWDPVYLFMFIPLPAIAAIGGYCQALLLVLYFMTFINRIEGHQVESIH